MGTVIIIVVIVLFIIGVKSIFHTWIDKSTDYLNNTNNYKVKESLPSQEEAVEKVKNILSRFSISGTYYREEKEIERAEKLQKGERLFLIHEPDNQYDKNAIKVVTEDNLHIGYIPKYLCRMFDSVLEGKVTSIYVYEVESGTSAPYVYAYVDPVFLKTFFD
nr:MAG TPA: HIRAN protein [Caudoviricetes sp.]